MPLTNTLTFLLCSLCADVCLSYVSDLEACYYFLFAYLEITVVW